MADQKITELEELTSVDAIDLLAIVDDPSGTPVTKKITVENLVGTPSLANLSDVDLTSQITGDLLFNVDGTNWEDTEGNLRIDLGDFEFVSNFTIVANSGLTLRNSNGDVFLDNNVLGGGQFQYSVQVAGNDGIRIRDNGQAQFGMSGGTGDTTLVSGAEVILVRNGFDVVASTLAASAGGLSANNTLTGAGFERVLTVSDLGSGGVSVSGTPVNNQLAIWTDASTIEGDAELIWDGSKFAVLDSTLANSLDLLWTAATESAMDFGGTVHRFRGPVNGRVEFQNGTGAAILILWHAGAIPLTLELRDGYTWRINDAGDTDWQQNRHNGTDFITTHVNTRYWSISDAAPDVQRVTANTGMFIGGNSTNVDDPMLHFYDIGNSIVSRLLLFTEDNGKTASGGFFLDGNFVLSTPDNSITWGHTLNGDILELHEDNKLIVHKPMMLVERAAAVANVAGQGQLWVRTETPNVQIFTDDDDVDQLLDPSLSEINTQNGNYTLVIGDKGKTIHKASGGAGETITIPANASVAYKIGTWVAFDNQGGGTLSIAITTDTMEGTDGSTGTQTLSDNGRAAAQKLTATTWRYMSTDL